MSYMTDYELKLATTEEILLFLYVNDEVRIELLNPDVNQKDEWDYYTVHASKNNQFCIGYERGYVYFNGWDDEWITEDTGHDWYEPQRALVIIESIRNYGYKIRRDF